MDLLAFKLPTGTRSQHPFPGYFKQVNGKLSVTLSGKTFPDTLAHLPGDTTGHYHLILYWVAAVIL